MTVFRTLLAALLIASTAHAEQYATSLQFPAGQVAPALVPGNAVHDMQIDGGATIRPYPWSRDQWHPEGTPDPTGVDCPQLADGIVVDGDRATAEHVFLKNVSGNALVVNGSFGTVSRASRIEVHSARNGVDIEATDAQCEHLNIDNIVHESVIVRGGGNTHINVSHVTGGDIGYHFYSRVHCTELFADNERIGGILESAADMSQIDNYAMLGCWERGLVIKTSEVELTHLNGSVPAATKEHPSTAGVELVPNVIHAMVSGALLVGEGSTGLIIRGDRNKVAFVGKWMVAGQTTSTLVKLDGPIHQSTFVIYCYANGGTVLDCSTAKLDATDTIEIIQAGNAKPIVGDTGKAKVTFRKAA